VAVPLFPRGGGPLPCENRLQLGSTATRLGSRACISRFAPPPHPHSGLASVDGRRPRRWWADLMNMFFTLAGQCFLLFWTAGQQVGGFVWRDQVW
jgi:hypothetical protein